MTVAELREALDRVDDSLEIVVYFDSTEQNTDVIGRLRSASVQYTHDENDTPYFALSGDDDEPEDEDEKAPRLVVLR